MQRFPMTLLACAALALSSCATPLARSPVAANYANPVLDSDFPDPAVLKAPDGFYYAYATQTEMGGKWTVAYGLYRLELYYSANRGVQTGVDRTDLELLYRSLEMMFDHDRSATLLAGGPPCLCGSRLHGLLRAPLSGPHCADRRRA